MNSESVISLVLSFITAITAIVAIVVSTIQISKSNKQSLLDRRIKSFLTVKWMQSLCYGHRAIAESYLNDLKNGPTHAVDFLFVLMTNTTALEEIQPSISHTLEPEHQRKYLIKVEELKNLCEEVRLIFPESIGYPLADFILYYANMLVAIYKYKVAIDSIGKECQEFNKPFPTNDSLEVETRKMLEQALSGVFELSKRIDEQGIFNKLEKRIRL